jgi:cell division protein FtsI (penicillin-binding protein 3)
MNPIFTKAIMMGGNIIEEKSPVVVNPSICSESTIKEILPLLVGVVEEGTATNIRTDKYKIAGKTGTTVLNYASRKEVDFYKKYQASFAGFFPADNPKYSCIVVINNPKNGQVYGGKVAAPIFKELADKVYALDMDIHNPIISTDAFTNLPIVKQGKTFDANQILTGLNIPTQNTESNWMVSQTSKSEVKLMVRKIEEDLQRGKMPNLKGMNLKDAVYLLETYGLNVSIEGSGSVVSQSIKKGVKFKKGNLIKLELA